MRDREAAQTHLIDPGSPEFLSASPDGRRAFFATSSALDPEGLDSDPASTDLYEWDEEAGAEGQSRCLTCAPSGPGSLGGPAHLASIEAGLGHVLLSPDLSHLYFYSRARLFPDRGAAGAANLYALDEGTLRFVAVTANDALRDPGVSTDGEELLFEAKASPALSADRIAPGCAGACTQLYLYEEGEASVECLSCARGRETAHGYSSSADSSSTPGRLAGDGSTAAFATVEPLLGRDVNGAVDLYEWRSGVPHLITDGVSEYAAGFVAPRIWAIDADGSDVFFGAVPPKGAPITGFERDGLLNVYDARAGGGLLVPEPREQCEGDACQGPLAPAPAAPAPASAGFLGRGNPSAQARKRRRCARGRVRRRGRCVPRRHRNPHRRTHR